MIFLHEKIAQIVLLSMNPFLIYTAYSSFIALWQMAQFSDKTKHNAIIHNAIIVIVGFVAIYLKDYSGRTD
ncbi:MAG: hypothetical protein EXX96DRAFT_582536 [Benjaminiella poitrasii]|nr:MAG: hypothetical protein EXX96DRAFT_582536 [Benjaminiella poitrasii]